MIKEWAEEVLEECQSMFGKVTSTAIYAVCDNWQDSDHVDEDTIHSMSGVRATAFKMAKDGGYLQDGDWLYCQTCKKEQPAKTLAWWKPGHHVHMECGHDDALYDWPNPPIGCPCCGTPECDRCF